MGFVLSILYLVIYYLTPTFLFGRLAEAHIEVILVVLVFIVSLPALLKSYLLKNPQTLALSGLAIAVFLSVLVGAHWAGGAIYAFSFFVPNALAYFLVCLHFNSRFKLHALALMMVLVCLFVIAHGTFDLLHDVADSAPPPGAGLGDQWAPGPTASPFLMREMNKSEEWIYRLQGLGNINDPNDFGQLVVCVIPLVFFFWRERMIITNILFVIVPVCILLFGLYLTHSRGALVALTAVALVAARNRIGMLASGILAGGMFIAATTLNFAGGRDISASAGQDRTALWGQGLAALLSHPVFGVGFSRLSNYTDGALTAHNSVVVCAAELGLFGLFFWSLYLFTTLKDTLVLTSPEKVSEGEPTFAEVTPFPQSQFKLEEIDRAEIMRMGRLLLLSLVGFLVAGLFLSRAFVVALFLLGGMAEVVFEMALRRGMVARRLPLSRLLLYAAAMAFSLLLLMYIMVRALNFMR